MTEDRSLQELDSETSRRELARQLLCPEQPMTFDGHLAHLRAAIDLFLDELAKELQQPFNAHVQSLPHATYAQKKELAKAINAQSAYLGLAIRCPKSGQPSYMVADAGGDRNIGRFQLRTMDTTSGRHRTVTSVELPRLTFMPAISSRSRSGNWARKICEEGMNNKFEIG